MPRKPRSGQFSKILQIFAQKVLYVDYLFRIFGLFILCFPQQVEFQNIRK